MTNLLPIERIENKIYLIRGLKVLIDCDLAGFYEVKTFNLNKAVKRNIERFPSDFMFQLTKEEYANLKFQFGISSLSTNKPGWGGRRSLPYAFTENGVAMLSSVLQSKRAVFINIQIMRAFTKLRQILSSHKDLARKVEELERKHSKHEIEITTVFKLLKRLMQEPEKPKRPIGFLRDRE
ncbi:MAG: ORF6N domain-containing protein [Candidatus Margulisiibacteriota bacterium]